MKKFALTLFAVAAVSLVGIYAYADCGGCPTDKAADKTAEAGGCAHAAKQAKTESGCSHAAKAEPDLMAWELVSQPKAISITRLLGVSLW